MSRETASALTPEEWRLRTFEPAGLSEIKVTATENGIYIHTDEYDIGGLDPHKMMAVCNLALTLDESEKYDGAIVQEDVDVCISAAWYFRKLARELLAKSSEIVDAEQKQQWLDHARSLTDGNVRIHALAELLQRMVPPRG